MRRHVKVMIQVLPAVTVLEMLTISLMCIICTLWAHDRKSVNGKWISLHSCISWECVWLHVIETLLQ